MKITIYTPTPVEFDCVAELTVTIPGAEQLLSDMIAANAYVQMNFMGNLASQISNVGSLDLNINAMLSQTDNNDPANGNITIKF